MYSTNLASFRKDLFNLLEKVVKYNEILNINTKEGNAVVMSEEEYNGLLATAEIMSNPELYKKIIDGRDTDIKDCMPESGAKW